ncbi:sensor domain-containing protein [Streptomyces sp. NPDC051561]|uniref:sensor histidine kinase n=1 Tax=Streptomyces sp. NPDC051561 TaxID=3365658 RepID=UPI0037AB609A
MTGEGRGDGERQERAGAAGAGRPEQGSEERAAGARGRRRGLPPKAAAFAVIGLPLSLLGVAYVLLVLYVGGLLSLTLIGLPLLAVGLRGARRLGRAHVRLARTLLGEDIDIPAPPPPATGAIPWIRGNLSDVTAWRSMLYLLLRLPVDLLALVTTLGLPVFGVWSAAWAVATGQVWWLSAAAVLAGSTVLALAPTAARTMADLHRLLARTLLGPSASHLRVRSLERARSTALTEGDRDLRQVERDLHDGTQAQLVALAITLSLTADVLTADALDDDVPDTNVPLDRPRALVARARTQTDAALAELRRLIDGISPAALDLGLADALPQLAARAGVPVALKVDVPHRPDPVIERVAYFCVAELLTNIVKHSGAARASVDAHLTGKKLRIAVHDNGTGGAELGAGSGLPGLRERLTAVDGTLNLHSPRQGPTTVVLEMPVRI